MDDMRTFWVLIGVILFGLVVIAVCEGGQPQQAPPVHVPSQAPAAQAPASQADEWTKYREVMTAAGITHEPVVVFVGFQGHLPQLPDTYWQLSMQEFPGVIGKAVVVGVPAQDGHNRVDLPWTATTSQIRTAANQPAAAPSIQEYRPPQVAPVPVWNFPASFVGGCPGGT